MANVIYKDIAIANETGYGASVLPNRRLHVISANLNHNPNKELIEDTPNTIKGRLKIKRIRNENEGDLNMYASPLNLHHAFELALGATGTGATIGASPYALSMTYNQNNGEPWLSKSILKDYSMYQEKFSGVVADSLTMEFNDNLMELTLNTHARIFEGNIGLSLADNVGETIKPYNFSDMHVYVANNLANTNPVEVFVNNFSLEYNNGQERSYLSGSRDARRTDQNIPTLEVSFTQFQEGASWVNAFVGCSEFYIRIEGQLTSCDGLINGVTPYFLRMDIPRAEYAENTRNYEQAERAMEEIKLMAVVQPTRGLIEPTMVMGITDITG